MAKNTVTFELGGRVEIRDLEKGINSISSPHFRLDAK